MVVLHRNISLVRKFTHLFERSPSNLATADFEGFEDDFVPPTVAADGLLVKNEVIARWAMVSLNWH